MITGHSILVHPVDFTTIPWCQSLHNWIYSFHMELFFMVSGAVYHRRTKYGKYIKNKFERLIVPMLFVGIVSIFFHRFGGDAVHKHTTIAEGLVGVVTGKVYWFLYTLFLIFVIYPLIEYLGKKWQWTELLLIAVLIGMYQFVDYPSVLRISLIMYYLPYFMIGHVLVDGLIYKLQYRGIVMMTVGSLVIYTVLMLVFTKEIAVVRYGAALAMIVAMYYLVQLFLSWRNSGCNVVRWINELLNIASKYSLQLYLFNGFVLVVARTILVSKLHLTEPVVVIPLIVVANLCVTLPLCRYVLERTKWIGWLCGMKTIKGRI